ncbi:MAG: N-6 DNA methylase [Chloroflexota bacterium]|nr:N-6 DNA methylase [Chloroflexota bacterium]
MAERLGIVYTPVEVVDFIIHSVEAALQQEFGVSISDPGVHVIDPFTGTGTFIVRLLQSGIIRPEDLLTKYRDELHANEIVLLAYYIAAINIEATYHDLAGGAYVPFEGIVLTDTFQLSESRSAMDTVFFPENNKRAVRQQAADIRVVIGNPPYSVGQSTANDNNQNLSYPQLDARIRTTYAAHSSAGLKRNLYDSYIRAIRWATDRIGDSGVICFVTNGSFIDSASADGLRKSLSDEFSAIYCFNLRGAARGSGEERRRERGNVFGAGTRTTVAITLVVKNPGHSGPCQLHYHDIGDYLTEEDKLAIIAGFGSIASLPWQRITPNANHDWINQRDVGFDAFLPMGMARAAEGQPIFSAHANGIVTNRDAWVYNFSLTHLEANVSTLITNYNLQVAAFAGTGGRTSVEQFIDTSSHRIKWSRGLKNSLASGKVGAYDPSLRLQGAYRPFCKQWLYLDSLTTEIGGNASFAFPPDRESPAIYVTGPSASKPFSALMIDWVPNLHFLDSGRYFPLYCYDRPSTDQPNLLADHDGNGSTGPLRRDAITDTTLQTFHTTYQDPGITKEDVFYYVYGILHSPEYRRRFEADLKKMLPRIPFAADFHAFSAAGRDLAYWHLNYETVDPWPLQETTTAFVWAEKAANLALPVDPSEFYRVSKMRFGKNGKDTDKSMIVYNSKVTLSGIPLEAYDYVVNGKPAIEWIMERYQISTDKDSGILNDPNRWSHDPRYIIDLLKRIVRVSIETNKIVNALPPLDERSAMSVPAMAATGTS